MTRVIDGKIMAVALAMWLAGSAQAGPLLTGIVEDVRAQTVEMPSLPGGWQRRIEWMAREGSEVSVGDLIVRLDPGDLITQEEQNRTDLDKKRLTAARRIDELLLEVMDGERAVAEAESRVRLAELDAVIPAETIAKLDYERYQLELKTARKDLVRAEASLLNKQSELEDARRETALEIEQAESNYERIKQALQATEIHAQKAGFMIYAENPWTGRKIFPGETLYSGLEIASVSSRDDLQVRFWVHEADILKVQTGARLRVFADALPSEGFNAAVIWVSSQAMEKQDWGNAGYFEVLAEPSTGIPEAIMPGMSVMAQMEGAGIVAAQRSP